MDAQQTSRVSICILLHLAIYNRVTKFYACISLLIFFLRLVRNTYADINYVGIELMTTPSTLYL